MVCLWGFSDARCIQLRCDLTAVMTKHAVNRMQHSAATQIRGFSRAQVKIA